MSQTRPASVASVAAAAALVVLLLMSVPAAADDLYEKLGKKEAGLAKVREREGVLTSTISGYRNRIERLTDEVAVLRNREARVKVRLDAKQAELNVAIDELSTAKTRLTVVRARLKRALVALRARLIAIYEVGTPDLLSVVVNADGYEDLIDRTEYLNRIHGQDEAVVNRVRTLRNQVQRTVTTLRDSKLVIESARDSIAGEKAVLTSARAELQVRQGRLVSVRRQREAALEQINEREHHIEGDMAEIQAEIAAQLNSSSSAPLPAGPVRYGSGQLIWPVDGPVVSSFGPRWGRMHEGIDIAVPAGTPIRSSDAGTVVLLQSEASSGGYGNFVCVDHGGGLQTCYAHLSSFGTSSGASVSQGQVIGYVGCTGHCYGDHLHFEVRISGAATDPLGYL